MNILVSGSVAYDRIMDFPGQFSDHILPEKIHVLNVAFTVNSLTEKFGGTAGNIAYSLALLGEKPLILATIGRDYHGYFEWLEKNNISCDGIKVINEELTACAYITTDKADNQITGFNPGAMKHRSDYDISKLDPADTIAIIAPGNLDDMLGYAEAYRKNEIKYIFDPGQQITSFNAETMMQCIEGSYILISNDYEIEMIMNMVNMDREELLKHTGAIITTLGEAGSCIYTPDSAICEIPPVQIDNPLDPTGAGDAFRSGLIKGLVEGHDLETAASMGSVSASFAVEHLGTQEHSYTMEEFNKRLNA